MQWAVPSLGAVDEDGGEAEVVKVMAATWRWDLVEWVCRPMKASQLIERCSCAWIRSRVRWERVLALCVWSKVQKSVSRRRCNQEGEEAVMSRRSPTRGANSRSESRAHAPILETSAAESRP